MLKVLFQSSNIIWKTQEEKENELYMSIILLFLPFFISDILRFF